MACYCAKAAGNGCPAAAAAVVCVSIICPPACPSYPPALPLSARAPSLHLHDPRRSRTAEASFPSSLLPHCKAQREIASSTPQTFQAGSVRNLSHRRRRHCRCRCRRTAFVVMSKLPPLRLPSSLPSSRPSFVLASMKTAMKIWPDRRPPPSSPLSTIFSDALPAAATPASRRQAWESLGQSELRMGAPRPRWAFFLEVSAPLGRSIGSFPPSERDLGRGGGSER